MSVVRIGLAPRAPGLSRLAAQQYWRSEHARLFARLPGILSYVQNHAILDGEGEPLYGEPGFDVFAEVEFDSETTLERAAASPYYRDVIRPDEMNLLDASRRTFLMTRRQVLSGMPQAALPKVALFLGRRAAPAGRGSSVPDRWLAEASALAPRARAVSANVVHRVGGAVSLNVDVVLQHYFHRLDDARDWYVEAQRRWTDVPAADLRMVSGVIAAEVEVVRRPQTAAPGEVRP